MFRFPLLLTFDTFFSPINIQRPELNVGIKIIKIINVKCLLVSFDFNRNFYFADNFNKGFQYQFIIGSFIKILYKIYVILQHLSALCCHHQVQYCHVIGVGMTNNNEFCN